MLAVRAVYENGQIHLEKDVQLSGRYNLIVIFDNFEKSEELGNRTGGLHKNGQDPCSENQELINFSLSCLEYAYGGDEPEYTDNMLKSVNPEFQP
ncbi:hypothetical protein [Desulfonatronovibrio magnus]|uniref:hypothetical protein n=1 Tax=Desulfonatronovibrio magnus TaxID=698827 RepID=UPI0005EB700D|nr:hypothetical protein [Desulfonatronovibrio magnus]